MRTRTAARLGVLASMAAGPLQLPAQTPRPSPILLGFPPSVQSAGLAGAGVAMIGYAGSIFVNPTGIAPVRALGLETAFSRTPTRSTYLTGAAAARAGAFNLGVGYQYLRFPDDAATYDNLAWAGTVVYRRGGIALGMNGKYLSVEDSAGIVTRSLTTDLGLTVAFFDIAAAAVSVRQLGEISVSAGGLELPRAVHAGASLNLLDTYSNGRLLATIETVWGEGEERRTVVGLEGGAVFYGIGLMARLGTGRQPQPVGAVRTATTYGGSLVLGRARLDYAYQQRSALGRDVHFVGARWTP